MPGRLRHRSGLIALAAMLALLAQSMLAGWALAAQPVGPTHDAFGNPLCITSHDGGHGPARRDVPNCCLAGCGPNLGWSPAPEGGAALEPALPPTAFGYMPRPRIVSAIARQSLPGNPRAPPAPMA